jgi:hypothetical protein
LLIHVTPLYNEISISLVGNSISITGVYYTPVWPILQLKYEYLPFGLFIPPKLISVNSGIANLPIELKCDIMLTKDRGAVLWALDF